jgi:hypothetical protein
MRKRRKKKTEKQKRRQSKDRIRLLVVPHLFPLALNFLDFLRPETHHSPNESHLGTTVPQENLHTHTWVHLGNYHVKYKHVIQCVKPEFQQVHGERKEAHNVSVLQRKRERTAMIIGPKTY